MKIEVTLTYPKSTGLDKRTAIANVGVVSSGVHPADRVKSVVDRQKQQSLGGRITEGAVGISKSILQIGIARKSTIESRRAKCDACDFQSDSGKYCKSCGCNIFHKTRLSEKSCPQGFWGIETVLDGS